MNEYPEINKIIKKKKRQKLFTLKTNLNFFFLILFFTLAVIFGVLFFILPKEKESIIEQRKLAEIPEFSFKSVLDGTYTNKLNIYYSDNVAFREQLVKAKFAIEENKGIRIDNIKIYGSENADESKENLVPVIKDNISVILKSNNFSSAKPTPAIDLNNEYYTDPSKHFDIFDKQELADKFGEYLNIDKNLLEGEQRGNLFVIGDTALEIFYGNEKVSKDYAGVINAYVNALGDNVMVYNMIVPNHFEFGLPEKYKGKIGRSQKPFIDIVKHNLDPRVIFVDIFDKLKKHYEAGEYLYFRTDHHWTGLGAYRAYEKFCENAGFVSVPLENYEKRTSTNFLGTLYNSCLDKNLEAHPDYVEYYVTDLPYEQINYGKDGVTQTAGRLIREYSDGRTNGYLTFMGGDIPLAKIETQNKNGRKIIVFKESYGNAFISFLVPHYETVYVADIRSFPFNSINFIKENRITDVLFLNNIMASNTSARVANILELMTK